MFIFLFILNRKKLYLTFLDLYFYESIKNFFYSLFYLFFYDYY